MGGGAARFGVQAGGKGNRPVFEREKVVRGAGPRADGRKRENRSFPEREKVVRGAGLEPACLTAKDPKSFVSANFTSRA